MARRLKLARGEAMKVLAIRDRWKPLNEADFGVDVVAAELPLAVQGPGPAGEVKDATQVRSHRRPLLRLDEAANRRRLRPGESRGRRRRHRCEREEWVLGGLKPQTMTRPPARRE